MNAIGDACKFRFSVLHVSDCFLEGHTGIVRHSMSYRLIMLVKHLIHGFILQCHHTLFRSVSC